LLLVEVDQLDQSPQLGRVLNLVLGLAEDDQNESGALTKLGQNVAVVALQRLAVALEKALPAEVLRDGALLAVVGDLLGGHLEEEQVGELLDVVAVGHAVVAQDVAVVPDALDDRG